MLHRRDLVHVAWRVARCRLAGPPKQQAVPDRAGIGQHNDSTTNDHTSNNNNNTNT